MFELRHALLAAYLDGEPASVAILNDYLMEQGQDPGKLHGNAGRRMRVVLGLIRPQLSHSLGCDFAEHVADFFRLAYPQDGRLDAVLETKRRWIRGKADLEQLKTARKAIAAAIEEIYRGKLETARETIARIRSFGSPHVVAWREATYHAARCAFFASTLSDSTARDCCGEAVRAAAGAPRDLGRSEVREAQWQLDHLRRTLLAAEVESS